MLNVKSTGEFPDDFKRRSVDRTSLHVEATLVHADGRCGPAVLSDISPVGFKARSSAFVEIGEWLELRIGDQSVRAQNRWWFQGLGGFRFEAALSHERLFRLLQLSI